MQTSQRLVFLITGLVWLLSLQVSSVLGQEVSADADERNEQIILQILELRQQIEDLLEILPEEMRREVEERWIRSETPRQEAGPEVDQTATSPVATDPSSITPATDPMVEPTAEDESTRVPPPVFDDQEASTEEEAVVAAATPCGGFRLFDTNEDSLVSGADRPWRFLRLWFDTDGDDLVEDSEVESLFDLGVRQIDVDLRFYNPAEGDSEDVDVDDFIWLRGVDRKKGSGRSGVLVIAADRLASDGRLRIFDLQGTQLTGFQPLGPTAFVETDQGDRFPLVCEQED